MQSMNHYRFNFCSLVVEGSRITTTSIRLVLCFVCPNKTLCLTSNQHLKGAAHRANAICCPYCKKSHTTASGVAHHLETWSGSCSSTKGVNRETIYNLVNKLDVSGAITNKQLTWYPQENESFIASSMSYNGSAYECYLCHKQYRSLQALNQHLSSPAHKQKVRPPSISPASSSDSRTDLPLLRPSLCEAIYRACAAL